MDLRNATDPVASRRAAGDGLRSGPGDPEPNEIAQFAADSLKLWYGIPAIGCEPGGAACHAGLLRQRKRPLDERPFSYSDYLSIW